MSRKVRIQIKKAHVKYSGSVLQQNYGEIQEKGFLLWTIRDKDDFDVEFKQLTNHAPYITIKLDDIDDKINSIPPSSRVRISAPSTTDSATLRTISQKIKSTTLAQEVVFKFEEVTAQTFVPETDIVDRRSALSLKNLFREYFQNTELSEEDSAKCLEMVEPHLTEALSSSQIKGNKWSLRKIEFDNTFGYGEDNSINFDSLPGITGLFGANRVGKSSIPGTIMYTLFNDSDRGNLSNTHIVNMRKSWCKGKAYLTVDGKNYIVDRQTIKKTAKDGKVGSMTSLNLFEADESFNPIRDLADEQRRDTEKVLRELIGNSDDFLLTSLSAQGEGNIFLKSKPSNRKSVLSKFLDLEVFDKVSDSLRKDLSEAKVSSKKYENIDYDVELNKANSAINAATFDKNEAKTQLERVEIERDETKKLFDTLVEDGKFTSNDLHNAKDAVDKAKKLYQSKIENANLANEQLIELNNKISKIEALKVSIPIESLRISSNDLKKLETLKQTTSIHFESSKKQIAQLEHEVGKLTDVPCGDMFPKCKYIKDAHEASKKLPAMLGSLSQLDVELKELNLKVSEYESQEIDRKLAKYEEILKKEGEHKIKVVELNSHKISENKESVRLDEKITVLESELKKIQSNLVDSVKSDRHALLTSKLSQISGKIKNLRTKIEDASTTIGKEQARVEILTKDRADVERWSKRIACIESCLESSSKNGIPLSIIRKELPRINAEISRILQSVLGFTVELTSDDGSNDMDIYINYGDSKRLIECCSGMEKMMSALAIRVALSSVSQLSRSDMLILDEGFGVLDDTNLDVCAKLLESLKNHFRTIFVITHVDGIKDVADCMIEVVKRGANAQIHHD